MVGIDHSIYFQQQTPDIMGNVMQGLKMSDMIRQRRKDQAIDDAYKAGILQNPDGSTSFNEKLTLSKLAGVDGGEFLKAKNQFDSLSENKQRSELASRANLIDNFSRISPTMKDQQTYSQGIQALKNNGVDVSSLPQAYDPAFINQYSSLAVPQSERFKQEQSAKELQIKKQMADLAIRKELREREEALLARDPSFGKNNKEANLKKLTGSDKQRFDNALMVAKAIDEMGAALDDGDNTFSPVGDNKYTTAETRAAEAFGRMQSGGAINKDEEKRFLQMLPRYSDTKKIQRHKLLTQREEMISRLKTLGFSPEDIGYNPHNFKYGLKEGSKEYADSVLSRPDANDAFSWAKKNPNDPRAKEIMKRIGGGG